MKSRTGLGVAVAALLFIASTGMHAQLGGLVKKKAADLMKAKPAPTVAKPAPTGATPAPTGATPAPTGATPAPTGTSPAPGATATPAAPAAPAAPSDPLDATNLRLADNVNRFVQEDQPVPEGEWSEMPYFGNVTRDALRLLDDAGRVAFVESTGPVIKALVQSDAFGKAHADNIRQRFGAVDNGLKGVVGQEDLMKKKDWAGMEAFARRQTVMNIVDNTEQQSAADIQRTLGYELESWRKSAQTATGKYQAKYQRYVKDGEALVALGASDERKLRRGYAVLKSIDVGGPDTEDAVYAMHAKAKQEEQQIAWDKHNLRSVLRQQLSAFVALASTVDFAAKTVETEGRQKFANAAYEKKGDIWKACYRAGKPATTAARQFAQAWLKELQ